MTTRRQLALILVSVIGVTALVSHLTMRWFRLDMRMAGLVKVGGNISSPPVLIAGSSMIGRALDWNAVAANLSRRLEGATTASASPSELEILSREVPDADLSIVSVSVYELDEQFISDFRADAVPIGQTVLDLWDSHADWPFFKRTMSRYPLYYLRLLFPTAGGSTGVMVGMRSKLRFLGSLAGKEATEALPTVNTGSDIPTNRIADWPASRLLRNLSEWRSQCHELHNFDGPKHLAFARMLHRLARQGKVVVVVLPVSPPYENDLLKPADKRAFEKSLDEIAKNAPEAK